eukprot:scaffold529_cov308-Pinguiococcus_pyrenoidosus.AAC.61
MTGVVTRLVVLRAGARYHRALHGTWTDHAVVPARHLQGLPIRRREERGLALLRGLRSERAGLARDLVQRRPVQRPPRTRRRLSALAIRFLELAAQPLETAYVQLELRGAVHAKRLPLLRERLCGQIVLPAEAEE